MRNQLIVAILFTLFGVIGCNTPAVYGVGVGVNRNTIQPGSKSAGDINTNVKTGGSSNHFADITINGLNSANGSYVNCQQRSGNWSVAINGYGGSLDNTALSVLQNDVACMLAITSFETVGSGLQVVTNGSPLSLTTLYQSQPTGFATNSGDAPNFYANAKLDSASFASNFVITIPFSDDPNNATGTVTGTVNSVSATANGLLNPSPNYTLDLSGVLLTVDANHIVQSISGQAVLSRDPSKGLVGWYGVISGSIADDYASIDAAWAGMGHNTPNGTDPMLLDASAFGINPGNNLSSPKIVTLILATDWNDPTYGSTRSYQKFTVTFN